MSNDFTNDPKAYLSELQRIEREQELAKLRTLSLEFAGVLDFFPKLCEELEAFNRAKGIAFDGLADRLRPTLKQAADLQFEIEHLPIEVKSTSGMQLFIQQMRETMPLAQISHFTSQLNYTLKAILIEIDEKIGDRKSLSFLKKVELIIESFDKEKTKSNLERWEDRISIIFITIPVLIIIFISTQNAVGWLDTLMRAFNVLAFIIGAPAIMAYYFVREHYIRGYLLAIITLYPIVAIPSVLFLSILLWIGTHVFYYLNIQQKPDGFLDIILSLFYFLCISCFSGIIFVFFGWLGNRLGWFLAKTN